MSVFIIAEAGVNHNGSIDLARKMIDIATKSGVDAIKFQTFNAKDLASIDAPMANYQKNTSSKYSSHFEMLRNLEIGQEFHRKLLEHCHKNKIKFISSPFDSKSVKLLSSFDIDIYKIPSGEITNYPLLQMIGSFNKEIILSTGMANNKEIQEAIDLLCSSGTQKEKISLLHCTSVYPTPFKEVNLNCIKKMKEDFNLNTGFSDHTIGIEASIAAVSIGATIIEKHFTTDKNLPGPDHKISLDEHELSSLVCSIRNIESALGINLKGPTISEKETMLVARKSIVALKKIKIGDIFNDENIGAKRPGDGISPMKIKDFYGKKSNRNYFVDEKIDSI